MKTKNRGLLLPVFETAVNDQHRNDTESPSYFFQERANILLETLFIQQLPYTDLPDPKKFGSKVIVEKCKIINFPLW